MAPCSFFPSWAYPPASFAGLPLRPDELVVVVLSPNRKGSGPQPVPASSRYEFLLPRARFSKALFPHWRHLVDGPELNNVEQILLQTTQMSMRIPIAASACKIEVPPPGPPDSDLVTFVVPFLGTPCSTASERELSELQHYHFHSSFPYFG